ncbi:MAG TPA: site-2 protease family protein [Candidatus Acidoferrales bacterium]|nr:site-2 protease family protein [Candidatus Acidoferrales bacterium]
MRWSLRIGTVAGIRIEVHVTFVLMLLGFSLLTSSSPQDALQTALELILVFTCVVLHELGHAFAARRFGIRTREIVLLPVGGVARLERIPEKPGQEMFIALAGPAVNVVLATAFGAWLFSRGERPEQILASGGRGGTLEFLFIANVFMLGFNLIPAFPMDGGRVLRAGLATVMPYARATRYASLVGQGFALAFAAVALFFKLWVLAFVALFVFATAGEERALVQTRSSLAGLPVSAAMVTAFVSLETRHELSYAVDLLLAGEQQDFPVLEDGQLLGMLSRADLLRGMRSDGPAAPVGRLVRLDVAPLEASMPLDAALQRMSAARLNALPVVARGRLVGLLTLENIRELMLVVEARQRHEGLA